MHGAALRSVQDLTGINAQFAVDGRSEVLGAFDIVHGGISRSVGGPHNRAARNARGPAINTDMALDQ